MTGEKCERLPALAVYNILPHASLRMKQVTAVDPVAYMSCDAHALSAKARATVVFLNQVNTVFERTLKKEKKRFKQR
jgi:hypothetical protein